MNNNIWKLVVGIYKDSSFTFRILDRSLALTVTAVAL